MVAGGGFSPAYERWVTCLPGFFLPVRVLSRLFRRIFLQALEDAFYQKRLHFHGSIAPLQNAFAFHELLSAHENIEWVVYAKPPFGGPQHVLAYLGRYTHKVAISNQRLLSHKEEQVVFQWKDYRHEHKQQSKVMTVSAEEFIRRFLLHTLPASFQRIRHFGFLANRFRKEKLALCRQLLLVPMLTLPPPPADCRALLEAFLDPLIPRCQKCRIGCMRRIAVLPAYRWPNRPPPDSS